MPSTGFTAFGTAANVAGADLDWTTESNALVDDNAVAKCIYTSNGDSDYLRFTNPGFSIPATAIIDGIEINVRFLKVAPVGNPTISFANMFLYANGQVGSDKGDGFSWGLTAFTDTFGGSSDTWGATLTPADVNASTFGFEFIVNAINATPWEPFAAIEYAEINVHYSQRVHSGINISEILLMLLDE